MERRGGIHVYIPWDASETYGFRGDKQLSIEALSNVRYTECSPDVSMISRSRKAGDTMSDMWLTYTGVLFGVAVAAAGVVAYLRMTRAEKRSDEQDGGLNPPGSNMPNRREDG
jgi:hypothetical protein